MPAGRDEGGISPESVSVNHIRIEPRQLLPESRCVTKTPRSCYLRCENRNRSPLPAIRLRVIVGDAENLHIVFQGRQRLSQTAVRFEQSASATRDGIGDESNFQRMR